MEREKLIKVGKKNAIYIPKEIAESIGISEGSTILMIVKEGKIELIPLKRPRNFWAEISSEEVEEVGEEITRSLGINS
ncbi:MAG: AbrB/MazE/SpoVT family DNA-binding domain-containing protein [Sulfolobaceae archaeon]